MAAGLSCVRKVVFFLVSMFKVLMLECIILAL